MRSQRLNNMNESIVTLAGRGIPVPEPVFGRIKRMTTYYSRFMGALGRISKDSKSENLAQELMADADAMDAVTGIVSVGTGISIADLDEMQITVIEIMEALNVIVGIYNGYYTPKESAPGE